MSSLFVGTDPQVQAWLDRRRELGQDGRDEVWEGVYHVVPHGHGRNGMVAKQLVLALGDAAGAAGLTPGGSFELGVPDGFRVPDLGFHRDRPRCCTTRPPRWSSGSCRRGTRRSPRRAPAPRTAWRSCGWSVQWPPA